MYEDELSLANDMADNAAGIALGLFGGDFEVRHKADTTPVTDADLRIEEMVRTTIAERFPDDAVHGEEEGLQGAGPRTWIVDPIDGTKNFADGVQIWGTLIALAVEGRPVVGLVSAPALGERYEAVRGRGATLNGGPIHASGVDRVSHALVCYGGLEAWLRSRHKDPFVRLVLEARRSRGLGDFWGHMLVARGTADAMLEPQLRIWDTSAVQVIVEEAGGSMTALDGTQLEDRGSALSTNGALHAEMVRRFGGTR